jgi:hypothetical protein
VTILRPGSATFRTLEVVDQLDINGTVLTGEQVDGVDRLHVAGIYTNFHDVRFRSVHGNSTDGTPVPASAASIGVPRISLAKGQRMKWLEEAPAGWARSIISFAWCKEAAGVGNVHWRLEYQLVNFLAGTDIITGAVTQVYDAAVAVPAAVGPVTYTITAAQIPTAPQAFGIPPLLECILTRINDGTDTYAGSASPAFTSISLAP